MSIENPAITQMAKSAEKPKKTEKSQTELRAVLEQKLNSLKPTLQEGIKEYEQALKEDVFEDQEGEPEGTGEARKETLQKKLTVLVDRAEKMKKQLDSGEILKETPEADAELLKPFLIETWKKWGIDNPDQVAQKPSLADPQSLDLSTLKSDIDPTKFGEYTLNPECVGLDFETAKIKVLDIQPEVKKHKLTDLASIGQYIIDTYSKDYIIPDLSFWQWLIEKGANAPAELLDRNYHFCFGSILRRSGGSAGVPDACWDGSEFFRYARPVDGGWRDGCRVVLLER